MSIFFLPYSSKSIKKYWESKNLRIHGGRVEDHPLQYKKYFTTLNNHLGNIRPKRILDVGCGDGSLSAHFSSYYNAVVDGIEQSNYLASKFRKRDLGDIYITSAGQTWDMELPTYDLVVCNGVVQYLSYNEISTLSKNIKKVGRKTDEFIFIISGLCNQDLKRNWYFTERKMKTPKIFIYNLCLYILSVFTSRLWADGSMWHSVNKVKKILLHEFTDVQIITTSTGYRSDFVCKF